MADESVSRGLPSGNTYQRYSDAGEACWTRPGTTNGASCAAPPTSSTLLGYDAAGQRTSLTPPTGTATTYAYDQAQRLKTISGATSASYAYNGDGLRTSKTIAGTTTAFGWDVARGLPVLLSQNTAGTISRFVYGPGGLPLAQVTGSTISYYHHDQLGSTRIVTNSTGVTVGVTSYDPFGQSPASWKSGTQPALAYAGQYTDAETGFQYLRARYYDPATAQFLTRDPVYGQTLDAYGYAGNNPLNATDPSGLERCWDWSAFWGGNDENCESKVDEHDGNYVAATVDVATDVAAATSIPVQVFGSAGICANGAAGAIIYGTTSSCVVLDNNGDLGLTGSTGGGFDMFATASVTAGPVVSNASVEEMRGWSTFTGGSGGEALMAGGDLQLWNLDCGATRYSLYLGVGAGLTASELGPVEIHGGREHTWVWNVG